jgi:hypothetical protein
VQTSFAEIPDALWERVERWIPKRSRSAKWARHQASPSTARREATQVQAWPVASLGGRAREQLAQQLPRAANPLGDESDTLHGARTHGLRVDCVPRGNTEKWTPILIVAVTVDLAVGAPVIVAALVNWNDNREGGRCRRSRIDELREHGHDALEQVDAGLVQLAFDQLIELHHVEVRGALHRRASGDRVVLRLIGP